MKHLITELTALAVLFSMWCCARTTATTTHPCDQLPQSESLALVEVAEDWGIDFAPQTQTTEMVEWLGAGLCLIDFDGDKDLDIYLLDSLDAPNRLYENLGGSFVEVKDAAGANTLTVSRSCLSYDYDGDGDYDLYVGNSGPDILYENQNGVFVDVTSSVGLTYDHETTVVTAGDIDNDGDLDLIVAAFVESCIGKTSDDWIISHLDPERDPMKLMLSEACGMVRPAVYEYRDGVYIETSQERGFVHELWALAGVLFDVDFDGDLDMYIGTDFQTEPSYLYINDGTGHFEDRAEEWGLRWRSGKDTGPAVMGVRWADIDGDDIYEMVVSNGPGNTTVLFDCVSTEEGTQCHDASLYHNLGLTVVLSSWGVQFADFDQDFDTDLFIANGPLLPNLADQRNQLFFNQDGVLYEYIHDGFDPLFLNSRSTNLGDLDGDGDLDLVVTNVDQPVQIFENRAAGGNYLLIELDTLSAGATIRATTSQGTLRKFAYTGGSYLGSDDPRVHFGLGDACTVDIEVKWIGGAEKILKDVPVNQVLRIDRP